MSRNRYYYYDHETCAFVEVRPKRTRIYLQGSLVLVVAFLLAGVMTWGLDVVTETPQELALKAENDALQQQIAHVGRRMQDFSVQLEKLAESDQDLYRTLFQAEPISQEVRQVGVGGVDPYERFSRFSASTGGMLRETAQMLDQLERQITLQNVSYRELSQFAEERSERFMQMPAILPADGAVVSGYGVRKHPILRVHKMHHGIDVLVDVGSPVVSTGDGVVKRAEFNAGYGNFVEIEHPATGYTTLYGHLSQIPNQIKPGRSVNRGEVIGISGNTGRSSGPHVHYEVLDSEGRSLNPVFFFAPSLTPQEYKKLVEEAERSTISLD